MGLNLCGIAIFTLANEGFIVCYSITEFCPDERSLLEVGMALLQGGSALHGIPVKYRSKSGQNIFLG
jgi:hypothetical protein